MSSECQRSLPVPLGPDQIVETVPNKEPHRSMKPGFAGDVPTDPASCWGSPGGPYSLAEIRDSRDRGRDPTRGQRGQDKGQQEGVWEGVYADQRPPKATLQKPEGI